MALREFVGPDGILWQIWNVRPTTRYSPPLAGAERRSTPSPNYTPDRRKGGFALTPGLEDGWLCFESAEEKRRLVPPPRDWSTCSDAKLAQYLRSAMPIRRRIVDEPDARESHAHPG
ncbi:MAG: hypothetical protein KY464_03075 [Gemmatimonadetes bacterium]|nr:hypothetical protein [Gemmatimonadota bacterium]